MNETNLLSLIVFIVAFFGMVLLHEFGHFIAARISGIEVDEFGIGLPPAAMTLFTWKGTRFTLNWLPLGGFVRPKGENDPSVPGGLAAANPWKRLFVLVSGPMMNLLTAVVIYSVIIGMSGGILTPQSPGEKPIRVLITGVSPNSPAAQGGFKNGDVIVSGAGKPIEGYEDLSAIVRANVDQPVTFVVDRNGSQIELIATPRMDQQEQRPLIGVTLCTGCVFQPVSSFGENLRYSVEYTSKQIYSLVTMPVKLLRGAIPAEQSRFIGLKGIYDIMHQSVSNDMEVSQAAPQSGSSSASGPFNQPVGTLFFVAILSISLGIFNLFPFPALDGGRILFVLPELIFRRRVSPQIENLVHGMGMALLLIFMLYVNVMDFVNPINIP